MSASGWLAVLLPAGLIATACGGGGAAPVSTRFDANRTIVPPIRAAHRTLPARAFGATTPFSPGKCVRPIVGPGTGPRPTCRPIRAEIAGRPASALEPVRVVAELRLKRPKLLAQRALFVAYRSRSRGLCFDVVSAPAAEQLACRGTNRCTTICLGWFTASPGPLLGRGAGGSYTLLWGLLGARADRLLVYPRRGIAYAVRGPRAPGFPGRRVFLADLGPNASLTAVAVLSHGRAVARATRRELVRGLR